MKKSDRKELQQRGDLEIRKNRGILITKHDSLNTRAKKLGIATDIPSVNRKARRNDLRTAIIEERKSTNKG